MRSPWAVVSRFRCQGYLPTVHYLSRKDFEQYEDDITLLAGKPVRKLPDNDSASEGGISDDCSCLIELLEIALRPSFLILLEHKRHAAVLESVERSITYPIHPV